jgi:RNase P subunit RPR2
MKLRIFLYKVRYWLQDHKPVFCFNCREVIFEKDAKYEMTQTGQYVPLCSSCHKKYFEPFSAEGEVKE